MADYRTERLAVVVVIVISGHDAVMVNDSYSVSEKVAKKKKTFWSCIVVALEIENVQRFKGRCIQADGKWATK